MIPIFSRCGPETARKPRASGDDPMTAYQPVIGSG